MLLFYQFGGGGDHGLHHPAHESEVDGFEGVAAAMVVGIAEFSSIGEEERGQPFSQK